MSRTSRTRRMSPDDQAMHALLARIDELESVLEVMEEEGLTTRHDVAARIAALEAEAAEREGTSDGS